MKPKCIGCKTLAQDLSEIDSYLEAGETREEYIINNEGTYNPKNGHFLCDACYIDAGMPSSPTGWKAP